MGGLHTEPKISTFFDQTLSPTPTFTWYPLDTNQNQVATAGTWRSITLPIQDLGGDR